MHKHPARRLSIIITAGPTREPIDPVRFISNFSTGTIGYKLAAYATLRGHKVTLISGPSQLKRPKVFSFLSVNTTDQMKDAVLKGIKKADALIMAAAVCDFRPKRILKSKIKKNANTKGIWLELVKNLDILQEVKAVKGAQKVAGFALETDNLINNARAKLNEKDLDFIVANRVGDKTNPFGDNKTDIVVLDRDGNISMFKGISKGKLAKIIITKIEAFSN